MHKYFDRAVVTLECPQCGNRMKETVNELRTGSGLPCSRCSSNLTIESEELEIALAQVATAMNARWSMSSTIQ